MSYGLNTKGWAYTQVGRKVNLYTGFNQTTYCDNGNVKKKIKGQVFILFLFLPFSVS